MGALTLGYYLGSHFSLVIRVMVEKLTFIPNNTHFHDFIFYGIFLAADLSV
jgi:hypothetical protein